MQNEIEWPLYHSPELLTACIPDALSSFNKPIIKSNE